MTEPPTNYDDKEYYFVSGKLLNQIGRMIAERTPIAGDGITETQRKDGVTLETDNDQNGPNAAGAGWRSFTDCDGNTFEIWTRNFTPAA